MDFENIVLKETELGRTEWENVEKLQPGENGFICIVSAREEMRIDENNEEYTVLIGTYFDTEFDYKPSYKEVIDKVISTEYPNGKEEQMLRIGIKNPQDPEYLAYYDKAEDIRQTIKTLLA